MSTPNVGQALGLRGSLRPAVFGEMRRPAKGRPQAAGLPHN
jgi:hypothetical protein